MSVELFEQFTASDLCGRRKTYKSYLKELYRYLYDIEFIDKDYSSYILKEPKIHEPSKVPTTYTDDEIRKMLSAPEGVRESQVRELDEEFIRLNVSPGGCADLLALTYFLYEISCLGV